MLRLLLLLYVALGVIGKIDRPSVAAMKAAVAVAAVTRE
jgi:hypothetical protein